MRSGPVALVAGVVALAAAHAAPLAAPLAAQGGPRQVADNSNAWLMYFGDHAVAGRWALHLEAQARRSDVVDGWQQLLLRPGMIYAIAPNVRLAAGYAFVETWPYGGQPAPRRFAEHRTWQQLQLGHGTGRVAWQHRYRLEQRWVHAPTADGAGTDRRYTNRVRYLARATVPLRGPSLDPGEAYASAYDEVMANVGRNTLDQNRLYGALGWRFTESTRVETGYMQQLVFKPDGVRMERNHTLQLAVFQSAPLFR